METETPQTGLGGSVGLSLVIDVRERELIGQLQSLIGSEESYKGIQMSTAQLPLGDMLIKYGGRGGGEERDLVVFERKTVADLFASIKDGRYEEQAFRLNGMTQWHNHNIVYVIEGSPKKFERSQLYSSLFSLNFYKGFSTMRTDNVADTAFYLLNTMRRIERNYKDHKYPILGHCVEVGGTNAETGETGEAGVTGGVEEAAATAYLCAATAGQTKKIKNNNICRENINEFMLCSIPGISSSTATALMKKYNNIETMINCLRQKGLDDLKDVCNIDEKGKMRKISKAVVKNIEHFLLC